MASSSEERDLLDRIARAIEALNESVERLNNSSRRMERFTTSLMLITSLLVISSIVTLTYQFPNNSVVTLIAFVIDLLAAILLFGMLRSGFK